MKVAILDDFHHAYEQAPGIQRLRARADVRVFTEPFGHPSVLAGCDALVANRERTRFSRELLGLLPDVRLIVQTGNHANHIDFAAAHSQGILIARASAGFSVGAAELAIGLALAVMRQIPATDAAVRRADWTTPCTPVMRGKVLGIIGFGRIGREVSRLAGAFGMKVIAWSPRLTDEVAQEHGAQKRSLDDVLHEADVLSLHAALTPASAGLIDASRLRMMKPTAFFINTARGGLVDEEALVRALRERWIAGAGLDVFAVEPLPAGHPLTRLPNTVLTPHLGWPTDDGYARFAEAACDVLFAFMDGGPVPRFDQDKGSH